MNISSSVELSLNPISKVFVIISKLKYPIWIFLVHHLTNLPMVKLYYVFNFLKSSVTRNIVRIHLHICLKSLMKNSMMLNFSFGEFISLFLSPLRYLTISFPCSIQSLSFPFLSFVFTYFNSLSLSLLCSIFNVFPFLQFFFLSVL